MLTTRHCANCLSSSAKFTCLSIAFADARAAGPFRVWRGAAAREFEQKLETSRSATITLETFLMDFDCIRMRAWLIEPGPPTRGQFSSAGGSLLHYNCG